jgi:hypothetical protein
MKIYKAYACRYQAAISAMRIAQHYASQSCDGEYSNLDSPTTCDDAGQNCLSKAAEPLQSWSLRARSHAYRELFDQGSHGMCGCFASDSLVCVGLQGATRDKLHAVHEWLLALFNKNYLIIDVTSADEGLMNVSDVLKWHVQALPLSSTEAPSFNAIWEFCDLVNNHMRRHPRSGVLLISGSSRNRAGLLVGSYFLSRGVCSSAIEALSLWSLLRSESSSQARIISRGVSNKMHQLYLSYFGYFCRNGTDIRSSEMPNNAPFTIGSIAVSYMGIKLSSLSNSSEMPTYELRSFINSQMFFSTEAQYDPDSNKVIKPTSALESSFFLHWSSRDIVCLMLPRAGLSCF